ncbi:MAG TPA: hypothetical protein VFO24_03985, partial [Usitatibacter sp.]|nr:hypothetical protein [Usitatibacter sp.]
SLRRLAVEMAEAVKTFRVDEALAAPVDVASPRAARATPAREAPRMAPSARPALTATRPETQLAMARSKAAQVTIEEWKEF